jgi:hypothetical protein
MESKGNNHSRIVVPNVSKQRKGMKLFVVFEDAATVAVVVFHLITFVEFFFVRLD